MFSKRGNDIWYQRNPLFSDIEIFMNNVAVAKKYTVMGKY